MALRDFRKAPSLAAERVSRNLIAGFLTAKGFQVTKDDQKKIGNAISQTVHATSTDGKQLRMRVKLCWRKITKRETYSASQLLFGVPGDWEKTVQRYAERAMKDGITHFLFVQPEENQITLAALVPASQLASAWCKQRDTSTRVTQGKIKNHAINGRSPTIWLASKNYPAVAAALWKHKGVIDLATLPNVVPHSAAMVSDSDDTFDDLPVIDSSLLGNDGASKVSSLRSGYKRSQKVRKAVLRRAGGKCERCYVSRDFPGFLDVHHILGIGTSDRVRNCVALCPNCHREAHYAPDHEEINAALLMIPGRFKQSVAGAMAGRA
jgi:5-methylcytosine-specific restriction protein A